MRTGVLRRRGGGLTSPCTVSMLPTNSAPTRITAMRPSESSKPQITRSLRAKTRGTARAVAVHAEQLARHVDVLSAVAGERHVDAVIVVRRQVDAREAAAAIGVRPLRHRPASNALQRVFVALRLQQPVACELPAWLTVPSTG